MTDNKEQKKIAQIICDVINKKKCKNCNFRCIAYEIAGTLIKLGCIFPSDSVDLYASTKAEAKLKEIEGK